MHVRLSCETESQPLQLLTVEPASGVAVSVTVVSRVNGAEQTEPQFIPDGLLVTVPPPVPLTFTVSTGFCEKVAVTDLLASMTIWHVPVPLQAPPQPLKDQPESGLALNVTVVLTANEAEHVPRQLLIPAGLLLTEPLPDTVTVSVNVAVVENVTVTVRLVVIVTVHCLWSEETESQPLQLLTVEPGSGVAVSVTVVLRVN